MKSLIEIFTVTLITLAVLMVASPARAQNVCGECEHIEDIIVKLQEDLIAAGVVTDRVVELLDKKLDADTGALSKLEDGKFCDAAKKLDQFRNKICDLKKPNKKGVSKIDVDDADDLIVCASFAINCICGLANCDECSSQFDCP